MTNLCYFWRIRMYMTQLPITNAMLLVERNGIFPASIDPRKNISAFVASMEKSRLSEIKFIAGAR